MLKNKECVKRFLPTHGSQLGTVVEKNNDKEINERCEARLNWCQLLGIASDFFSRVHYERVVEVIAPFLTSSKILLLLFDDEAHQFVVLGTTFCTKFRDLRKFLFSKLTKLEDSDDQKQAIKVPFLLMATTFDKELMIQLHK